MELSARVKKNWRVSWKRNGFPSFGTASPQQVSIGHPVLNILLLLECSILLPLPLLSPDGVSNALRPQLLPAAKSGHHHRHRLNHRCVWPSGRGVLKLGWEPWMGTWTGDLGSVVGAAGMLLVIKWPQNHNAGVGCHWTLSHCSFFRHCEKSWVQPILNCIWIISD